MKDSFLNHFFKRCSNSLLGVGLAAGLAAGSVVDLSPEASHKQLSLPATTSSPSRIDPQSAYLRAEALEFDDKNLNDAQEAFEFYRIAAEQRYAPAEYSLALMYEEGRAVEKNLRLAAKWYRLAAEQGVPQAQNNLGLLYKHGDGVQQDSKMAFEWFSKAVAQGNMVSATNLADAYRQGFGTEKNTGKAFELYQVAAPARAPVAQNNLALMFANGQGVTQNYTTAYAWMSIATKELPASLPILARLRTKLSESDLVEADHTRKSLNLRYRSGQALSNER